MLLWFVVVDIIVVDIIVVVVIDIVVVDIIVVVFCFAVGPAPLVNQAEHSSQF